jgi:hypothetical protein
MLRGVTLSAAPDIARLAAKLDARLQEAKDAAPNARFDAVAAVARALAGADLFAVTRCVQFMSEHRLMSKTEFRALVKEAQGEHAQKQTEHQKRQVESAGLPKIDAGDHDLPTTAGHAWNALRLANRDPFLFRFGGLPVRIESDDGRPVTRRLTEDRMRYVLARAAMWYRVLESGNEKTALPPVWVVKDVLATPDISLPPLDAIVSAPVFAPDGTLQTEPGYHPKARTFYKPSNGFKLPDVPKSPTGNDLERAKKLILDDLLGEFPFTGDAERAHAVALGLLPYARPMIQGATPIHLVEKPAAGTGGTLMVHALLWPALGQPVSAMTEGRNEDEWRKRITARLLSSPPVIFIDNLRRRLDSSALAAAVTAPTWSDRILGKSETVHVPIRNVWIATGNNPALSNELTRRGIRIRLDAQCDRPWLRPIKNPRLLQWVREHRGELVWAALTLIQNWIAQGCPSSGDYTLGMFQDWADTMGGILDAASIPGFLGNLSEFYNWADTEDAVWRGFLVAWWTQFGEKSVGTAQLFEMLLDSPVGLVLSADTERVRLTQLGGMIARNRDRRYTVKLKDDDGEIVETTLLLTQDKTCQGAAMWKLLLPREPREPREPNPIAELFQSSFGHTSQKQNEKLGVPGKVHEVHEVHDDYQNAGEVAQEIVDMGF